MYLLTDLEQELFGNPYEEGYRKIKILSGYASSAFLTHIVDNYPGISLELTIGMAGKDGIYQWDHDRYNQISLAYPNIEIKYQKSIPGIHSKIYHWYKNNEFENNTAFIGSSNFSWNGFRDQRELMCKVNLSNLKEAFENTDTINCTEKDIQNHVNINSLVVHRTNNGSVDLKINRKYLALSQIESPPELQDLENVELSLLASNGKIHERGGLNWGQREGREPNQAYIPVPAIINSANPHFFPPLKHEFILITDDGKQLSCIMAQQNRKAIETTESNSELGKYFRRRLNLPYGARVDVQDLLNYGRDSVIIYKIDRETYFMDFGTV